MTYNSIKYRVSYCLKKLFQFVKAIDIEYSLFPCLSLVIIERNQIRRFLNIDLSPFTIFIIYNTNTTVKLEMHSKKSYVKVQLALNIYEINLFFFSVEFKNYGTLSFKETGIQSTMWK